LWCNPKFLVEVAAQRAEEGADVLGEQFGMMRSVRHQAVAI
jgi:hypothetical protein